MSVEGLIASHLRIALDDLREAAILLEANGRNSVYLGQQAAEQMILAIAQAEGIHFGRDLSHRLDRMLGQLPESNAKSVLETVAWLEAFATTYRYPKASGAIRPPPDKENSRLLSLTSGAYCAILPSTSVST
jgi:HEPN domain-containing protein